LRTLTCTAVALHKLTGDSSTGAAVDTRRYTNCPERIKFVAPFDRGDILAGRFDMLILTFVHILTIAESQPKMLT
jgi:hypothetical protein